MKNVVCLLTLFVVAIASAAFSRGAQDGDTDSQIESLRRERRDTLGLLVETVTNRNAATGAHLLEMLDARRQLLKADLELARSHEERVSIHQKIVENLQEVESIMNRRHENGTIVADDVLKAKAARLKAAIRLLEVTSTR